MNNEPLVLSGHRFDIGYGSNPSGKPMAVYGHKGRKRAMQKRARSVSTKAVFALDFSQKCIVINKLIPACRGRAGQQPVPGREWACGALEEAGDRRPEAVHIDQERIVSLNRGQAFELQVPDAALQYGGQFFLLMQRKQEI